MDSYLRKFLLNSKLYTFSLQRKYDLLFLLKIMIKTFMMNELELIFLSYFLEENKWDYLSCLSQARKIEKLPESFHNIYDVEKPMEYKSLILYLYHSCFAVKQLFHEQNDLNLYLAFISKFIQGFHQEHLEWRSINQRFFAFDTYNLNRVYEKNAFSWKEHEHTMEQTHNLESMVNTILEMSPPYLYERPEFIYFNNNNFQNKKNVDINFGLELKNGIFSFLNWISIKRRFLE